MMRSLAQLLIDNAQARLGIPPDCVELILNPRESGDDDTHRRTVTVRELRTIESEDYAAVGNASAEWPGEVEWFLTIFEILITCRPEQARRDRDYYPNEARLLANQVRAFLRGRAGTGRIIDRVAWEKSGAPVEGAGVAQWQRTDPQPRDDGDPAFTYVLTYEMTWWAPAPPEE
jgi:hypothetical protein